MYNCRPVFVCGHDGHDLQVPDKRKGSQRSLLSHPIKIGYL